MRWFLALALILPAVASAAELALEPQPPTLHEHIVENLTFFEEDSPELEALLRLYKILLAERRTVRVDLRQIEWINGAWWMPSPQFMGHQLSYELASASLSWSFRHAIWLSMRQSPNWPTDADAQRRLDNAVGRYFHAHSRDVVDAFNCGWVLSPDVTLRH